MGITVYEGWMDFHYKKNNISLLRNLTEFTADLVL